MNLNALNKILLLITGHAAGYMIIKGIDGFNTLSTTYFTISFGVIVLTCLALILFGFKILENAMVVFIAALIPLSLSLGIIREYLPNLHSTYSAFSVTGLAAILYTRVKVQGKIATIALAVTHGIAGLVIVLLPIYLVYIDEASTQFILVSFGGALVGLTGLLLAVIKIGNEIISKETVFNFFPLLLLISSLFFVIGMVK